MIKARATFHLLVISNNRHDLVDSFRSPVDRTSHATRLSFDYLSMCMPTRIAVAISDSRTSHATRLSFDSLSMCMPTRIAVAITCRSWITLYLLCIDQMVSSGRALERRKRVPRTPQRRSV